MSLTKPRFMAALLTAGLLAAGTAPAFAQSTTEPSAGNTTTPATGEPANTNKHGKKTAAHHRARHRTHHAGTSGGSSNPAVGSNASEQGTAIPGAGNNSAGGTGSGANR